MQRSKAWSNKGVCSTIHLEFLLQAEQAALDGKKDDAADAFKKVSYFLWTHNYTCFDLISWLASFTYFRV
jgi:hypothetical protein